MRLVITRIYGEAGLRREAGLCSFDLEVDEVSCPAEIDALVKKLTELRMEMTVSINSDNPDAI